MTKGPDEEGGVSLAVLGAIEVELGLESLRELITLYLADTAKQLAGAQAVAAAGGAEQVRKIAHRIKSMSGYLGALAVEAQCHGIEAAVREGRPLDLVAEVGKLELLFGAARPQLEAYAAKPG